MCPGPAVCPRWESNPQLSSFKELAALPVGLRGRWRDGTACAKRTNRPQRGRPARDWRAPRLVLSRPVRHTLAVPEPSHARVTYREVLRDREVRGLLLSRRLVEASGTRSPASPSRCWCSSAPGRRSRRRRRTPCSYLTWLLGGPVLSALADRYPRRRTMVVSDLCARSLVACLAVPGLSLWAVFAVLVRWACSRRRPTRPAAPRSPTCCDGERYVVANALSNAVEPGRPGRRLPPRRRAGRASAASAARCSSDAATFAGVARCCCSPCCRHRRVDPVARTPAGCRLAEAVGRSPARLRQPPAARTAGLGAADAPRPSSPPRAWPSPSPTEQGGGPVAAGVLTAAVPAGFLLGSGLVLRVPAPGASSCSRRLGRRCVRACSPRPLVDRLAG